MNTVDKTLCVCVVFPHFFIRYVCVLFFSAQTARARAYHLLRASTQIDRQRERERVEKVSLGLFLYVCVYSFRATSTSFDVARDV